MFRVQDLHRIVKIIPRLIGSARCLGFPFVENSRKLYAADRNEFRPYLCLVPRRITQKVVERVVDCAHNGVVRFIEFGPGQENFPYLIPFEAKYSFELPLRKEWTLCSGSQTLSDYLAFPLVQIG